MHACQDVFWAVVSAFVHRVLSIPVCTWGFTLSGTLQPWMRGVYELEMTYKNGSAYDRNFEWDGLSATHFYQNFWPEYDAEQLAFPKEDEFLF